MDINSMIAVAVTFVLGLGGIAITIGKFLPKITKYVHIIADLIVIIDSFTIALKPDADGKITVTKDEVDDLVKKIGNVKVDIAALKA